MSDSTSPATSSKHVVRATKRKLDDAFESLDAAVAPKKRVEEQPSAPKRQFNARSIYSTLSKYGIKSKVADPSKNSLGTNFGNLSKSTPNLSAILSRAATRTRKAFPFKPGDQPSSSAPPLSPLADYRPSSIASFLARLETFKLATYANKPPALDAVATAKCGWINDGKDRLVCGICNTSWVVVGREGMTRDAANALIEKQRISLVQAHKNGCPWKSRQCDDSIYRIPLQTPTITVQNLKVNASTLDTVLQGVEIRHPLTPTQLSSLQSVVTSFKSPNEATPDTAESSSAPPSETSTTAVLTSLFGWSLAPERPRNTSVSRSNTRLNSATRTPALSRASSVAPTTDSSGPVRPLLRTAASKAMARDASLLQCVLCQRRVGLWAFSPPKDPPASSPAPPESEDQASSQLKPTNSALARRQFDLLKEHRSYCPYVVRSTIIPSLPISPSVVSLPGSRYSSSHVRSSSSSSQLNGTSSGRSTNALEGWRAVLTVVLRYRMAQRHQSARIGGADGDVENAPRHTQDDMDVDDGVESMMQGVKARGGNDLLKYVKGLLG